VKTEPYYTLFLDETGDHTIGPSTDIGKKYLGIAGPFLHRGAQVHLDEAINRLKTNHLPCTGATPVLHRKEIMQCRGPFSCLGHQEKKAAFDAELVSLVGEVPFKLLAVVIDKGQHGLKKYRSLRHPYHYCLHALLERYCGYLNRADLIGHVVAEARGKEEDYLLRSVYKEVYLNGTSYLSQKIAQKTLFSSELEIRKKSENISGLQLADILAHPATRDVLFAYKRLDTLGSVFTEKMVSQLRSKYNRKFGSGTVNGYGRILLS
jgi:hypothetical protein